MAENEKEQLKKFIHQLPNAVNGDGKAFVAQLKKALSYLSEHAGGSGGGEDSGEGEDAINQVTALRLVEVHTVDSSGFPKNNIEVTFDNSNIENYAFAQIWVKDDTENTYQQHGNTNGTRYLFENALVGRTYTVKVVVQLKDGRTSNFDNAPTASILIQGSVLIPDAPTQFFLTWDEDGALWQWQYEENEYIDFFELRLDANAGVYNDKLLDRTRLPYSRANPNVRSGTAYLFIRNIFGDYSTPATHIFNKPVGVKPNKPVLQATLDGVVITMSPLPTGYQGYILEIDGEEFKTINRQFVYYKFSGTVKARYCYYDEIGRGEWSEYESVTIKVVLDPDELPEISYDAFDQTIKDAIDGANAQKDINKQLQDSIKNLITDVDEAIGDVNNKIDTSVSGVQADIDGLLADLNKNAENSPFTSIKQTADGISVLSAEISDIDGKTETNASNITLTNDRIDSLVFKVNEVDEKTTTNASNITQTAEAIESLVFEKVELLEGKIATNASNITQTAKDIRSEITEEVSTLDKKINANTSSITQTANSITSLVYEQVNALDSKINTNTSKITQTASEIETLVANEVETLNGKIATNASQIAQSANKIETLVVSIDDLESASQTNASTIKQTADNVTIAVSKINQLENDVKDNTASISVASGRIDSVVSGLDGDAGDSGYQALTGLASSIVQTNSSISSVITELNKNPEDCSYSAITQLKDGIDLSVKNEDLTGKEIISRINISPEMVTIDGKYLHVTGDTVFDENIIVGGYIAAETIVAEHLKMNSVTSAKIAANAITADKIAASSITSEKITDKSITGVKIEDGAITAIKIEDGAVSSTKIEGGAVTTEHIQAGSIIGEHISAGAVSADKLFAGDIDMTGELALVGGAVRLNEEGLTCRMADGASTVFDALGITYFNKNGSPYSQIRQSCMGFANNGQTVTFQNEWDSVPTVICIPTTIQIADEAHKDSDILLKCKAVNVTKNGFDVQCYTCLPSGSSETISLDVPFVFTTDTEFAVNNEIIDTPSEITITFDTEGYSGRDGSIGKYRAWYTFDVYNDGVLIGTGAGASAPTNPGSSWSGGRYLTTKANVNINASVERIGVLTVKVWVSCYYFRPSGEPTYNYTPSFDPAHLTVQSITYTPKDDIVISTGTALFVAMSDANTGYRVSDTGVTPFALRRQYRLGV